MAKSIACKRTSETRSSRTSTCARTQIDLTYGTQQHFEEKEKHMRKAKPRHFFNAKVVGADCGDDNPWCLLASSMKRITAILEFARNVRLLPKHFALRKYGSTSVRRLRDDVYKIPKLSSVECNTYWRAIALTHLRVRCALRRGATPASASLSNAYAGARCTASMRCIARLVLR